MSDTELQTYLNRRKEKFAECGGVPSDEAFEEAEEWAQHELELPSALDMVLALVDSPLASEEIGLLVDRVNEYLDNPDPVRRDGARLAAQRLRRRAVRQKARLRTFPACPRQIIAARPRTRSRARRRSPMAATRCSAANAPPADEDPDPPPPSDRPAPPTRPA